MARGRQRERSTRRRGAAAVALLAAAAACARSEVAPPASPPSGIVLSFEDRASPEVFRFEGPGLRVSGAPGSWATVPGLPRPERADAVNLDTGARTTVALFSGGGGVARLSREAADALGLAPEGQARVRITALRREPRVSAAGAAR